MNLIIVESPTKARTLGRFLGSSWVVDSTMGHIRDLPKSKIGVDIEHNFTPEYVTDEKKSDTLARLKKEAKNANEVYLATDPDREGEAIAWHVKELLPENSKLSRVTFHEITESAVKEAIEHPREINMQLVDAQQARRILDRLVGYKLSPLLWKKVRKGLSAGRVQSVAVRLIVEKEREIEAFKAVEYWEIMARVTRGGKVSKVSSEFDIRLVKIGEDKAEVKNKEQADKILSDLNAASYKVKDVQRREVRRHPYPPFTTSTLTQAASRNFYWSAKKTMSVAQKLYEEGLITYHRTDSTNLAVQAINSTRDFIGKEYGEKFLPEKPRIYKTSSKMAQEAHEAIRPTDIKIQIPNEQSSTTFDKSQMGRDGEVLYSLIWKRFVACQMADAVYDETRIEVLAGTAYTLRASGQIMKFEGWKILFKGTKTDTDEPLLLPVVEVNEALQLIKAWGDQKFTEPPARYTEASLVKTLEKLGIGRPSTYAPTITTIQDRQYVEKNEGKFSPTSLGTAVNDFLVTNFDHIVDYNFTAEMEGSLDEIAEGKHKWVPVIKKFWDPFSKTLKGVENLKRVKIETETTGNMCPLCGEGEEVIRVGKFGKFLSCSRFPECKYTAPFVEKIEMKCPECKTGDVVVKKTRRGKKFFGCSNYPTCKFASWRKPEVSVVKNGQKQVMNTKVIQTS